MRESIGEDALCLFTSKPSSTANLSLLCNTVSIHLTEMPGAEYNFRQDAISFSKGGKSLALEIVQVPLTGKILEVKVSVGNKIKEGDVICILESMKMENPILCPVSGTIKEIKVSLGQAVKTGNTIAVIEY